MEGERQRWGGECGAEERKEAEGGEGAGTGHSPAGRTGWMGRHLRVRSLSTTSQLFLPISKMPRSRTCSAAASGGCGNAHGAEGTAAAAEGASSSPPPSRALTRPPRFPRGMAEPQAGPKPGPWEAFGGGGTGGSGGRGCLGFSRVRRCHSNRAQKPRREAGRAGGAGRTEPSTLGRQPLVSATQDKKTPEQGEE